MKEFVLMGLSIGVFNIIGLSIMMILDFKPTDLIMLFINIIFMAGLLIL